MRKFLFVLTVTWLHISCESKALVSDPAKNGNTVADVDPVSEVTEVIETLNSSYSLSSSLVATDLSGTISLDCANAEEVGFSTSSSEPTEWQTCVSGDFTLDLDYGVNNIYVWVKKDENNIVNVGQTSLTRYKDYFMGPTPSTTDKLGNFARFNVKLSNGNIVITNESNDVVASNAGAVHLFSGYGEHINTIYGERSNDAVGDEVGPSVSDATIQGTYDMRSPGIVGLSSGNFVIISRQYNTATLSDVGRVAAYNGTTGAELWKIEGERANDALGDNGGLIELSNGNILLNSSNEDTASLTDAGTIRLINPTTGAEIARITGDKSGDEMGSRGIHQLANGNIIIVSSSDDNGAIDGAGSVTLTDAGLNIITTIRGARTSDLIGEMGFTELDDSKFAILSPYEDTASLADVGSVAIYNGSTGALIGKVLGDQANDYYGSEAIVKLSNGNLVLSNPNNDSASVADIGSAVLMGQNGSVIATLEGTYASDGVSQEVEPLTNGYFVISRQNADTAALTDAGKVILVNGSTGAVIATIEGDQASDKLSSGGLGAVALGNGNFVVQSINDEVSGIVDAGSFKLINGTTGAVISTLAGNNTSDRLGAGVVPYSNNNFLACSPYDDENGLTNNGSCHLVNGTTGAVISSQYGTSNNDLMGYLVSEKNNYTSPDNVAIVPTAYESVDGNGMTGVIRFISTDTGEILKTIEGSKPSGMFGFAFGYTYNHPPLFLPELNAVLIGEPNYGLTPSTTEGRIRMEVFPSPGE